MPPPAMFKMDSPVVLLIIVGVALLAVNKYVNRKRLPPGIQELPGPTSEISSLSLTQHNH